MPALASDGARQEGDIPQVLRADIFRRIVVVAELVGGHTVNPVRGAGLHGHARGLAGSGRDVRRHRGIACERRTIGAVGNDEILVRVGFRDLRRHPDGTGPRHFVELRSLVARRLVISSRAGTWRQRLALAGRRADILIGEVGRRIVLDRRCARRRCKDLRVAEGGPRAVRIGDGPVGLVGRPLGRPRRDERIRIVEVGALRLIGPGIARDGLGLRLRIGNKALISPLCVAKRLALFARLLDRHLLRASRADRQADAGKHGHDGAKLHWRRLRARLPSATDAMRAPGPLASAKVLRA